MCFCFYLMKSARYNGRNVVEFFFNKYLRLLYLLKFYLPLILPEEQMDFKLNEKNLSDNTTKNTESWVLLDLRVMNNCHGSSVCCGPKLSQMTLWNLLNFLVTFIQSTANRTTRLQNFVTRLPSVLAARQ